MQDLQDFLTIAQAIEMLNELGKYRTSSCIRHLCNKGRLEGARLLKIPRGDIWMIPRREIMHYFFERSSLV